MADVRKIAGFLGSLWALLATLTVLFPTAAQFLHVSMIEGSALKDMYVVAGTTLSALALLFVLTFARSIWNEQKVRIISGSFIVFGCILLFAFIALKTVSIYDHMTKQQTKTPQGTILQTTKTTASGRFSLETSSEDAGTGIIKEDFYERTSLSEVLALALFSFMLASFTVAFTTLGVFHYNTRDAQSGIASRQTVSPETGVLHESGAE